jgi:hypothetical protein
MKTFRPKFAMNSLLGAVCLALFAVACTSAFAQSTSSGAKPITLKGLEDALKIGGLKDSELISQIQSRGVDFILTPQITDALKGLGASAAVIQAVGANYRGTEAPNVNPPPPPPPPPVAPPSSPVVPTPSHATAGYPSAPGIYFKQGSAWTRLHQESVAWHSGLAKNLKVFTHGVVNAEATGEMPGAHSATSVHAPVSFLIWPANGLTVGNYLIVHLHGKKDDREFKISLGQLHSEDQVDFRPEKVNNNLFEVDFSQGQGDYAFVTSRDVPTGQSTNDSFLFTFQIVQ